LGFLLLSFIPPLIGHAIAEFISIRVIRASRDRDPVGVSRV
jgi:hypothetical protein